MILVSGGTGFVGSYLVPRMVQGGQKVRCLVRSSARTQALREWSVELASGDVTEYRTVREAMEGADAVVHLVAIIRESKQATFDSVNVHGTRNMVQAAEECGVTRFVHLSALGASNNPRYRYTCSKWQGEEAVRASHLDFVILRPSAIFGRAYGRSFIDSVTRSLRLFPFVAPVPGSGKTRFQPIWVEDVAACIVKALEWEAGRRTYDIGGPEHLSYEQILDAVLGALGERRAKLHMPVSLLRLMVPAMEAVMSNPLLSSVELSQLELDNTTCLGSVERHFGFKPLALRQGLDYIRPA